MYLYSWWTLLCYVKETIPHKNRSDIAVNVDGIERIVIQVKSNSSNIIFIHIYRPPNARVHALIHAIEVMLNRCLQESKYVYIVGFISIPFYKSLYFLFYEKFGYFKKKIKKL